MLNMHRSPNAHAGFGLLLNGVQIILWGASITVLDVTITTLFLFSNQIPDIHVFVHFQKMDTNRDGYISVDEFMEACRKVSTCIIVLVITIHVPVSSFLNCI